MSSAAATVSSTVPVVLLGGSEDTRLLLRGLLRLHRHRVLLETATREGIDHLPASTEPKILILDAGPDSSKGWAEELSLVLQARPDLRALVILSSPDPALDSRARQAGAKAVLVRPFAIRDFIQAVESIESPLPPP